MDYFQVDDEIM